MASALKPKNINFNELWPIVLGTVRSVINMSQYGYTDKSTWQTRFFGLIKKNLLGNIYIIYLCRYL